MWSQQPYIVAYPHAIKIDGETGEVLLIKEIGIPVAFQRSMNIMPGAEGESLYIMWIDQAPGNCYINFAIIDKEGNFIEEPFPVYDYTDEPVQSLHSLDSTVNESGDVFAIWSALFPDSE